MCNNDKKICPIYRALLMNYSADKSCQEDKCGFWNGAFQRCGLIR